MNNEELGRRAVACKHFRWMAGMLRLDGVRLVTIDEDGDGWWSCGDNGWWDDLWDGLAGLPDLTDPATLGCLLALVKEEHGAEFVEAKVDNTGAGYWMTTLNQTPYGPHAIYEGPLIGTYAEALVAALEAAP